MNTDRSERPLPRLIIGALVGAVVGLGGWLVTGFTAIPEVFTPTYAAAFLAAAVVICGLGRLASGGVVGPVLGMVVGFVVGVSLLPDAEPKPAPALIGQRAEIVGPMLDDRTFDIAALRGKVVLVDFWATWCPPCVAEMPALKDLYAERHEDGFEIVGVSLDRRREQLERYVRDNDIAWPQIFFPEQEQQQPSPLARQYGVTGIPHTLLIDRDGRIVAVGLRGRDIDRAVKELLAGKELTPREPPPVSLSAWWLAMCGGLLGAMIQAGARGKGAGT